MSSKLYIFVIGNEKGGAGKTTCSVHLIVALLYQNYSVVSIDTDSRQSSLTNYLKNRELYNKQNPDKPVLVPKHFHISESREEEQANSFEQILKNNEDADYIVIDTPGSYTALSRLAHSYADVIITPINDSFLDLDVIAKIDSEDEIISPSIYSQMIWEQKMQRASRDKRSIDWIILRNRLSNLDALNKRRVSNVLNKLAKRINFKLTEGFSERVIYKELFLQGLTLLDLKIVNYDRTFNSSHVLARQELRNFLRFLDINPIFYIILIVRFSYFKYIQTILKIKKMHKYRTHNCNKLKISDVGTEVKLSGWVHRRRDHGNLVFVDLRDYYGITQIVFTDQNPQLMDDASRLRYESVITVTGKVVARSDDTINNTLLTGHIEILAGEFIIESSAGTLPFVINTEKDAPEESRLKHRFLDLRREKLHNNIILRSQIISHIRHLMTERGFTEFQTPILTASSPEGARDFLVLSRLHPGKFYALPQAPQQFKQLLMVSGFDRYFQIAPCFRDEDARADRSPGEFYQLDVEMSFVTQKDVFNTIEPVMYELFTKFTDKKVSPTPFTHIPYSESMLKYGSDKPDLRNPIIIADVTEIFRESDFTIFHENIKKGSVVRAIPAPKAASQPRSFFDKMIEFAMSEGAGGLGYIQFSESGEAKGPVVKFLTVAQLEALKITADINNGDAVFFASDKKNTAAKLAGKVRIRLAEELDLLETDCFKFCWITDFQFYELNDETGKIDFSHNPFSMPQGGIDALEQAKTTEELLELTAYQYDIVCNGIELSSGAIRNHKPEIMYKAFAIAGYSEEEVDKRFGGMIRAFKFGAPPHGGIAPGIDRIVMLLANAENIREIIAFPLNQQAEDLLMNAPNYVEDKALKELSIMLSPSARRNVEKE